MTTITLARQAMATRFEIVLHGTDAVALRAAGEEALDEIERLDAQLSPYRPTSDICHLNARAATEPVRVEPRVFQLLAHARRLHDATHGAFDLTVGPLLRCWGFRRDTGHLPTAEELAAARAVVGMNLVELNAADSTVRFARPGVQLDLGAIGKGYALERAAELLREAGVTCAMLHGGTSTAVALGAPPDAVGWNIAIEQPPAATDLADAAPAGRQPAALLTTISLRDAALSVSAVWGKAFEFEGKVYGHVLDPRTGQPVADALLAAVVTRSATETDALSTGLLTLGRAGLETIAVGRPDLRALVVTRESAGTWSCATRGLAVNPPPAR